MTFYSLTRSADAKAYPRLKKKNDWKNNINVGAKTNYLELEIQWNMISKMYPNLSNENQITAQWVPISICLTHNY